jgi:molecular chaperone GrpE
MKNKPKTKVDELRDTLKKKKAVEGKAPQKEASEKKAPGDDNSSKLKAAEEVANNCNDKLLRMMAEFENSKKRMAREHDDLVKYGNEKLLTELLPSLDDLDRVLDHVPEDASEDAIKIADGIELVRKSLLGALAKFGLKEVAAEGEKFDPVHHEAVAAVESEAHEPGSVMAVHRKGYELFDRLIRPSMVTVAKE